MEISTKVEAAVGIIVVTVILLALTNVVVAQVQTLINVGTAGTSTAIGPKWNFTGYSGALSIMGLVPFIWIASVLLSMVAGMILVYKG